MKWLNGKMNTDPKNPTCKPMNRRTFFAAFSGLLTALGLRKIVPGDRIRHAKPEPIGRVTDINESAEGIRATVEARDQVYVSRGVALQEAEMAYSDAMMDPPPDRSGRDLADTQIPAARYIRIHGISQTKDIPRGAEPEMAAVFGGHPIDWEGPVTARDRISSDPTFDQPGPALFTYKRRGLKIDGSCNPAFIKAIQGIHERADTDRQFRRRAERYILSFATEEQIDAAATAWV